MIDVPIDALLNDRICLIWLERHLHAEGFTCPRCSCTKRRLCRAQGHFPADRCRVCAGDDTRLTGTVFEKTRPRPATLVLLRGVAKGEPTARLAREVGVSRKPLQTLRQCIQAHLNATAPTGVMTGTAVEADELYQNAGEKAPPIVTPWVRHAGTRISARGTAPLPMIAPSMISMLSRETGEQRFWVCDHAGRRTCANLIPENVPRHRAILYTDAWQPYRGSHPAHATVCHGVHEWARDDEGAADARSTVTPEKGQGGTTDLWARLPRGPSTVPVS